MNALLVQIANARCIGIEVNKIGPVNRAIIIIGIWITNTMMDTILGKTITATTEIIGEIMSDWPKDRCPNCGEPKEADRRSEKYCQKCSSFLEPTERIEIKVTKYFLRDILEAMKLGHYGKNRTAFIREAIRQYIRHLKREPEEKNVIEGAADDIILGRMKTAQILKRTAEELEGMP